MMRVVVCARKKLFVCKCFFVIPDRECDLWFRGNGLIGARIRCGREHSDSECNQKKNRETFHNTTSIANFFLPDKKNPAPPLRGGIMRKSKKNCGGVFRNHAPQFFSFS